MEPRICLIGFLVMLGGGVLVETVLGAQAGVTWKECLERECLGKCLRVLGGVERIRGECLGGMLAVSKF